MTFDRITRDPAVMNGQPCIRGMRITVRRVLEAMATYPDRDELFREYPELELEDLQQALAFAAASMDDKLVELTTTLTHHTTPPPLSIPPTDPASG